MVLIQYQLILNTSQQEAVNSQKEILSGILAEYKEVKAELKAKTTQKKELIVEQKNCGIHFIRAKGSLSLLFIGAAAKLFYKYKNYEEKPYLYVGIGIGIIGVALMIWFGITG